MADALLTTFAYLNVARFTSDTFLVDVRTPMEVEDGKIDALWWANVPLSEVRLAFSLNADAFEAKYNAKKPTQTDEIILQCRSGARSGVAQNILTDLGYTNTKNLSGGIFQFENKLRGQRMQKQWAQLTKEQQNARMLA